MSKDPTPHADALRAQREARYGHLQATAEPSDAEAKLLSQMNADRAVIAKRRVAGESAIHTPRGPAGPRKPRKPRGKKS